MCNFRFMQDMLITREISFHFLCIASLMTDSELWMTLILTDGYTILCLSNLKKFI